MQFVRYDMPEGGMFPPPWFRGRIMSLPELDETYCTYQRADGLCVFVARGKYAKDTHYTTRRKFYQPSPDWVTREVN